MTTTTKTKSAVLVFHDGKHTYTIRKNPKKGYDKYIILASGKEFMAPAFSWFPTLKQAISFCTK